MNWYLFIEFIIINFAYLLAQAVNNLDFKILLFYIDHYIFNFIICTCFYSKSNFTLY